MSELRLNPKAITLALLALAAAHALVHAQAEPAKPQVVPTAQAEKGEQVYRRMLGLAERFLNIGLDYLGAIPRDPAVARSVMRGEPVVRAYPRSPAALALLEIADTLARADHRDEREGAMRLFWRRLLRQKGE